MRTAPFTLNWGAKVYAKILGYNIFGNSAVSDEGFDAVILTYPDAPTRLKETAELRTKTSITFSWSDGASDGGSPIIDYRVNFDQSLASYVVRATGVTSKSFTVNGLTTGLTYKFKVESRNSFDYSAMSEEIAIICATNPSVPLAPTTANLND